MGVAFLSTLSGDWEAERKRRESAKWAVELPTHFIRPCAVMRCSTALLLALSACICLTHLTAVQALYAATCEDLECTFTVGRVRYTTNEFGGRLGLLNMDGSVMVNSTVFGVGFSYLTERTRGVLIDVGLQNCYFDVGDPLTEAAPTGHDRTFGDLINNFHLPSLPTTVQNLPNHPYPGVTTVEYTYWAEGRPLFIQTFSVSDRDFVVHLSNDTRFTLGIPPTATYKYAIFYSTEQKSFFWLLSPPLPMFCLSFCSFSAPKTSGYRFIYL